MERETSWLFATNTTGDTEAGIQVFEFDTSAGRLEKRGFYREGARNPLFLRADPAHGRLFASSMVPGVDDEIGAFRFDAASGTLALVNVQSSGGRVACYLEVNREGTQLLTASYTSGTSTVLPISVGGELGSPRLVPGVEPMSGAKTHSIVLDPENAWVAIAELGNDRVLLYEFDASTGELIFRESWRGAAKSGPRHFVFHPNGRFAYLINEYANTVVSFAYEGGRLVELETLSTLPDSFTEKSYAADLRIHPNGRFLYGSNRGHDSIVIFALDPESGRLELVGHAGTGGSFPRSFRIDSAGAWLLVGNEKSHNIATFAIHAGNGTLEGAGLVPGVRSPSGLELWPAS